ncbi:MAG TPA: hypothetical protein VK348_09255, partial [Planctomycetota bacterium]|nr:hypothetical protein [Planctomycetota bacterium]
AVLPKVALAANQARCKGGRVPMATWVQLQPAHAPPARWSLGMATDFANARVVFFNQAIVLDPGVNTFGAVVSNAGSGIAGTL